jgi:exopolyphosphatase / guanosine-5'-triphosphate,3'-diphosphate pyrophosphatase
MARRREHLAAIDVGTNAARLKIARHRSGRLDVVHSDRAAVEPGEGVFDRGVMTRAAVDRLCAALSDFVDACRFHRADVRAVATSAVRSARNRDAVIARVKRDCGLELEVIDGIEEARLTALGVLAGADGDERSLCIDIGGGSTEIMLSEGEELVKAHSVDVGGVRLNQRVGDDLGALRKHVHAHLTAALPAKVGRRWIGDDATAIGCSGSVRALVDFATSEARRYLTRAELSSAVEELARMKPEHRVRFFGRRGGVALPAAVILEQTMERLGLWAVRATRRGLRDGVLVELSRARRERLRLAS